MIKLTRDEAADTAKSEEEPTQVCEGEERSLARLFDISWEAPLKVLAMVESDVLWRIRENLRGYSNVRDVCPLFLDGSLYGIAMLALRPHRMDLSERSEEVGEEERDSDGS